MTFPDFVYLATKTYIMVDGTLPAYDNDGLEKNVRRGKSFKQTNQDKISLRRLLKKESNQNTPALSVSKNPLSFCTDSLTHCKLRKTKLGQSALFCDCVYIQLNHIFGRNNSQHVEEVTKYKRREQHVVRGSVAEWSKALV